MAWEMAGQAKRRLDEMLRISDNHFDAEWRDYIRRIDCV